MSLKTIVRDLTANQEKRDQRFRSIIADYVDIDLLVTYRDRDVPQDTYIKKVSKPQLTHYTNSDD